MAVPKNKLPPLGHNKLTFDDLLKKATTEYKAYKNGLTKPTERLYAALEAAYKLEFIGTKESDAYEDFIQKEYDKKKLGKITKATRNAPFMPAIRLILGNDEKLSPDRTRYSLALTAVAKQIGNQGMKANVAEYIKNNDGIDGLVKKIRTERAEKARVEREKKANAKKGKGIIFNGTPKGQIPGYTITGEKGFRFVLCNLKADGNLDVYDKEITSKIDVLFRSAYSLQERRLRTLVQPLSIFPSEATFGIVLINRAGRSYAHISEAYHKKSYPMIKVFTSSAIEGLPEDEPVYIHEAALIRDALKSQEHDDIKVTKEGSFEFQVSKFYDGTFSTLTGGYQDEALKVINDVLGTHLPNPITKKNIGNKDNITKHLISAIQNKYALSVHVRELCTHLHSKMVAATKQALVGSINQLLGKELDAPIDAEKLLSAIGSLKKAIAAKYPNKPNQMESFLDALASLMGNQYPLKAYTISQRPNTGYEFTTFLEEIRSRKTELSANHPLKTYKKPENAIIFSRGTKKCIVPYTLETSPSFKEIISDPPIIATYSLDDSKIKQILTWEKDVRGYKKTTAILSKNKKMKPKYKTARITEYDMIFTSNGIQFTVLKRSVPLECKADQPFKPDPLKMEISTGILPKVINTLRRNYKKIPLELGIVDPEHLCITAKGDDGETKVYVSVKRIDAKTQRQLQRIKSMTGGKTTAENESEQQLDS